ncbi:MAG: hypothetical protein DMD68_14360 [Gemmatimonadetes bacterium]|nr:MAG: hypothetical protein DMD74_05990 [Gemmatimonadota bacterium]PYO80817.1 MAG: hypothetical protein DMD68_14360 [Gemmatimonadota bacterium]
MHPVTYTHIDRLPASRDKVYALLTDPKRIGEWLPGCAAVDGTSIKRGARLTAHFGQRTTEFEVVDLNPGRTFGWVEYGQRNGAKVFFRLDQAGEATSITIQIVWKPRSLLAWVRGRLFSKRNVERQVSKTLENLRRLLGV